MHLSLQWGATALVKAIEAGKVERVKLLLDAGVQVNAKNEVSAVLIKQQLVVCLCTVSGDDGAPMMVCIYHYSGERPHWWRLQRQGRWSV